MFVNLKVMVMFIFIVQSYLQDTPVLNKSLFLNLRPFVRLVPVGRKVSLMYRVYNKFIRKRVSANRARYYIN